MISFCLIGTKPLAVPLMIYCQWNVQDHIDGLVEERRNSIALAMEFRPSCTNPLILE